MSNETRPDQWRAAADVLRRYAAEFEDRGRQAICGVVANCGPNSEPLACGYLTGHEGPHAWGTLPTFPVPSVPEGETT